MWNVREVFQLDKKMWLGIKNALSASAIPSTLSQSLSKKIKYSDTPKNQCKHITCQLEYFILINALKSLKINY